MCVCLSVCLSVCLGFFSLLFTCINTTYYKALQTDWQSDWRTDWWTNPLSGSDRLLGWLTNWPTDWRTIGRPQFWIWSVIQKFMHQNQLMILANFLPKLAGKLWTSSTPRDGITDRRTNEWTQSRILIVIMQFYQFHDVFGSFLTKIGRKS